MAACKGRSRGASGLRAGGLVTAMRKKFSLKQINALSQDDFVYALDFLFEGSPWIAARTWEARPLGSVLALHEALCSTMYGAGHDRQVALIQSHPDLVGKAALAGTLTPESAGEQASAGLDQLSPEEGAHFAQLNAAYHERFGFPFVICVRENKEEGILAGFDARLNNSRDAEIDAALGEIAKIAWLRLLDVVKVEEDGGPAR